MASASRFSPLIERATAELRGYSGPARATGVADALGRLLDLVLAWNARTDLTAARDDAELVDLYLADALVIAASRDVAKGRRWIDVGSGAGAPGLVLALLAPDLELTLVEPKARRVAFLRSAVGALSLANVRVERSRSDALPAGGWQVALSRATLPPPEWLAEGARLATDAVWVLLARAEPPALGGWHVARDVGYRLPLGGAERRALCFTPLGGSVEK